VLSFEVTISGATLTPEGGGSPVEIVSPGDSLRVDFAALMGFNTVLNLASVPAGTYTEINLTLADPQLTVLEGTPPAPTTIPATFTQASVTVPIEPRLVVTADTPAGLILDFLLLRSLETDANGDVTGVVDPMFRVLPSVITTLRRMGDFDDLRGIVQSVNTTSSNPAFLGSFTLQRRLGRTLLIQVTNQTQFENVSGLEGLTAGLFVEVEGFVNADGNIVAQEVEAHEQTDTTSAIFVGPVISVTRDGSGNATSFTIWVREEFPDVSLTVPRRAPLTVNLTPESPPSGATWEAFSSIPARWVWGSAWPCTARSRPATRPPRPPRGWCCGRSRCSGTSSPCSPSARTARREVSRWSRATDFSRGRR
jgi:hypothetical protein